MGVPALPALLLQSGEGFLQAGRPYQPCPAKHADAGFEHLAQVWRRAVPAG